MDGGRWKDGLSLTPISFLVYGDFQEEVGVGRWVGGLEGEHVGGR